jgi:hypothetical protein
VPPIAVCGQAGGASRLADLRAQMAATAWDSAVPVAPHDSPGPRGRSAPHQRFSVRVNVKPKSRRWRHGGCNSATAALRESAGRPIAGAYSGDNFSAPSLPFHRNPELGGRSRPKHDVSRKLAGKRVVCQTALGALRSAAANVARGMLENGNAVRRISRTTDAS